MSRPWVQQLVDQLLDRAQADHPHVEFVVSIPADQILLIPRDSQKLWRTVDGRLGHYRTHVYRDCDVCESPADQQMTLSPLLHLDHTTPANRRPRPHRRPDHRSRLSTDKIISLWADS